MLYASDLVRFGERFNASGEEDIDNLPDLVGRLMRMHTEAGNHGAAGLWKASTPSPSI